mmetsp:Transcript_12458/g.24207  ORF Transcript_12458/g.24207 Transcript_12458/m.24207 type:complete len:128 (-) Transcript_12458:281-664(-)
MTCPDPGKIFERGKEGTKESPSEGEKILRGGHQKENFKSVSGDDSRQSDSFSSSFLLFSSACPLKTSCVKERVGGRRRERKKRLARSWSLLFIQACACFAHARTNRNTKSMQIEMKHKKSEGKKRER